MVCVPTESEQEGTQDMNGSKKRRRERERERERERRRESRVRPSGRGLSACSVDTAASTDTAASSLRTASTGTTGTTLSSSLVDSDEYDAFSMSAASSDFEGGNGGGRHGGAWPHLPPSSSSAGSGSVYGGMDYDMGDAAAAAGMMGGMSMGVAIDTHNPLASFVYETGPFHAPPQAAILPGSGERLL